MDVSRNYVQGYFNTNLSCRAIISILFFRGIYIGHTDNMQKVVEKAQLWESEHSFISQMYF